MESRRPLGTAMADLRINDQRISPDSISNVELLAPKLPTSVIEDIRLFLKEWWDDREFIETKTSGSTGSPKTIRLLKSSVLASATKTISYFHLNPGDCVLLCLPTHLIAGKLMLVRAITGQLHVVATPPDLNPLSSLEEDVDFAAMIPSQVRNALRDPHSIKKLKNIPQVLIGGAPIDHQLEKQLSALPNRFFHSYGMTETATHVALREIGQENHYTALDGVQFSQQESGCLVIHANHLPEPIFTTDLVELIDAHHFNWLGRADHAIISGGIKHIPELLEQRIASLIDKPFYITGAPDPNLGQKLVLVIESDNWPAKKHQSFLEKLNQVFTRHEIPKEIQFIPRFKRTESGKIVR